MEDVSIGMYNGKWSYFPTPDFQYLNDDRFAAFQEPFQIVLTNEGKVSELNFAQWKVFITEYVYKYLIIFKSSKRLS